MKKKELLNEIMGVPKALDFWVDGFTTILTGIAKKLIENDEIEETDFDWHNKETGEEISGKMYRNRGGLDGKQVMEYVIKLADIDTRTFLKSDNFKKFPLYNPSIKLTILFLPDQVIKSEMGGGKRDLVDASHNSHGSRLAPLGGEVMVFSNQKFTFKMYAPTSWLEDGQFNQETFKKSVKPSISHELLHAYETYMRIKNSGESESTEFFGRETMLNTASNLMKDRKYPQWSQFLTLVYLHLSFEINARITQLYYELKDKNIKTPEEFTKAVKSSTIWEEVKKLEDFNAEKFIKSFEGSKLGFMDMIEDIGTQMERVKGNLPAIKPTSDPKKAMIHLIDGWNTVLQRMNKELSEIGYTGKLMDVVPEKAMKDPIFFFKFFEKRFHKKAEKFKKKLLRVSSLILNQENT